MSIAVSAAIPNGSIDIIDGGDPGNLRLALRRDPGDDPLAIGYYHFRVTGARRQPCVFRLVDAAVHAGARLAGREDYEDEWTRTGPHLSYDRRHWFRVAGQIEGQDYVFRHTPEHDVCYIAKWAPYPADREADFVARCQFSPRVRVSTVARTTQGADLDLLTVGESGPGKKVCWIIARQHPSETMGGYFIEGLLTRLLDENDPVARRILDSAYFQIVPNMNPDGARCGFTRVNGAGVNLNREWSSPSVERSPEVWHVRSLMERTGVNFFMDCHGDEELRCVFLAGPLEIPSRAERTARLFQAFEGAWAAASPDYVPGQPYPGGAPAEADLRMAWNWVGERFRCLSLLLEQPFKDTTWWQDPVHGWSPERAHALGGALPTAILGVLPDL